MKLRNILITIIIVLIIVLLIGFLYTEEYIKTDWTTMVIILGTLAIPYKYLKDKFSSIGGDIKHVEEVIERQDDRVDQEKLHRANIDNEIHERELRLEILEKRLETIDAKLSTYELKKRNMESDIMSMSDQELVDEFEKRFKK